MSRDGKLIKRFDASRRLEVNERIELVIPYGNYEGEYSSQIVDIVNHSTFVINTPFLEGKVVNLAMGSTGNILLRDNNGLYQLPVKIVKRKVDTTPLLVVELVGEVNKIQEREFFRLDIFQEISFRVVLAKDNLGEHINSYEKLVLCDKSVKYNGLIQDVSAGGLKMTTREDSLIEGQIIEINFDFAQLDFDILLGKIIRVFKEVKQGEKRYNLGIKFIYQHKAQSDKLLQWLFSKQRELRKKGLI